MCRLLGLYGRVTDWRNIVMAFSSQAETGIVPQTAGIAPGHEDGWGMTISNRWQLMTNYCLLKISGDPARIEETEI